MINFQIDNPGNPKTMRATTLCNRLLNLEGAGVTDVAVTPQGVTVEVRLRRRRLVCPECDYSTRSRYDTRDSFSSWRHLRLGAASLTITARLRRLRCPTHGVRVECVPFARHRSGFTRDFEDLVAWLATKTDKTALCQLVGIDWDTVGRICERVTDAQLDVGRLDGLFNIGVDEVSWKKHHNYLTLVVDHDTGKVVWGGEGKKAATLDAFFTELGAERTGKIEAVSMDMGAAFRKSATLNAPQAVICFDPFHVIGLVTDAVEKVRREGWQQLRLNADPVTARRFKGARWALLKNPETLTEKQAATLKLIKTGRGTLWRAYQRKEELREIFREIHAPGEAATLLKAWCGRVARSRMEPFIKAGRTIREHIPHIVAAIERGLSNGRVEGLNRKVRLIIRRAFGFHSARAALALVKLSCGPVTLTLPWARTR